MLNLSRVVGLCLVAGALAGCGSDDSPTLVPATGTVYYNDKPISGAMVTFQVEGKPLATGQTNAEGKFVITTGGRPGAPLGDAKVGIAKTAAGTQDMTSMKPDDMRAMQMANKNRVPDVKPEIPVKYGDPQNSKLVATLSANGDENVFEFRLTD